MVSFFKQKTAYEMRISDWSSDVCSSDLPVRRGRQWFRDAGARVKMAKSKGAAEDDVVTIKKYANRRLYDTERSCYITLDDLGAMVRDGRDFRVVDANSGDDMTHNVLTQLITDEETRDEKIGSAPSRE